MVEKLANIGCTGDEIAAVLDCCRDTIYARFSDQKNLHVGIYGLIEQDVSILVVRKSRGTYKGLFDLPGGRPSQGEDLLDALNREADDSFSTQ
jgi:8-oxo-dGTP pyrophosphatase MutT (NUDIX family)